MEREQEELQFLGFFGILRESLKIITHKKHHRKIFFQITVTLILPLTFIFLAHSAISELLVAKIDRNEHTLDHTYNISSRRYQNLSNTLSWELTQYWLIQASYLTFLIIFSLLSTSAIVYTIASLYTAVNTETDLTFRKVMSVVPKVWKRLLVTFLCNFGILLVYNGFAFVLLVISLVIAGTSITLLVVFFGFYLVGFVYIGVVWHLASVVSVLEDRYGIGAMRKSRVLLSGKMTVAVLVYLAVGLCSGVVKVLFEKEVVKSTGSAAAGKVGYGVICFLLLSAVFLFGMVVQTVVYLVCKSYHHENIDKSELADHLQAYLGDYVPLTSTDIQMEHI